MLLSLLIYSFMMFSCYFVGKQYIKDPNFTLWTIAFIYVFFAGCRYDVGIDHLAYLSIYEEIKRFGIFSREDIEFGFILLTQFFAYFKLHYIWYFMACACLQILPILFLFKNEKYIYKFIIFFLLATGQFFFFMNGIRQGIAFSFLIYSLSFIQTQKWFLTISIIILAASFHTSALLFSPFILSFIYYKNLWIVNKTYRFILIIICYYILPSLIPLESIMSIVDNAVSIIGYERYNDISSVINEQELNFGFRSIINLFNGLFITFYANKVSSYYKNPLFPIIYNLVFVGLCITPIFIFSQTLMRFVYYFNLSLFIADAFVAAYLYMNYKRKTLYLFMGITSLYLLASIFVATKDNAILYQFAELF